MPTYGQRRVPGLRREELALLAGVSLTYYTRLEQGHATNASQPVVDALGRALQLDEAELAHLRQLAQPPPRDPPALRPEEVRDDLAAMISDLAQPAMLLGRANDLLAWNRLAHRVFASHLDPDAPRQAEPRPNQVRMLFLDPDVRALYRDWDAEARLAVASLRFIAGQYPDDPAIVTLVGELTIRSQEFASLWDRHPVERCTHGTKRLHHPEVGDLDLDYEVLHAPDGDGQRLLLYRARPGTPSETSLRLLGVG